MIDVASDGLRGLAGVPNQDRMIFIGKWIML